MKKLGFILILGVVVSCSETDSNDLEGLKEQRKCARPKIVFVELFRRE